MVEADPHFASQADITREIGMSQRLEGKKIAILATDGFEEVELTSPCEAVEGEGAIVHIIAPKEGPIWSFRIDDWGDEFSIDHRLDEVKPDDYHMLILPGGVLNPDNLRTNSDVIRFVQHFFDHNKPCAAICHAPWTLISADVVRGRRMTSYHTVKQDLINAGAHWVDEPAVVDNGLVTSRNPDDLEAFNAAVIEQAAAAKL